MDRVVQGLCAFAANVRGGNDGLSVFNVDREHFNPRPRAGGDHG